MELSSTSETNSGVVVYGDIGHVMYGDVYGTGVLELADDCRLTCAQRVDHIVRRAKQKLIVVNVRIESRSYRASGKVEAYSG